MTNYSLKSLTFNVPEMNLFLLLMNLVVIFISFHLFIFYLSFVIIIYYFNIELSLRVLDDVASEFGKDVEGEKAFKTLAKVRNHCQELGFKSACFVKVQGDYYDLSLEARMGLLCAPNVDCLCKSLILENTECTAGDCSDKYNSRFYCIIVQYVGKINSNKIFKFVRSLAERTGGVANKKDYHFKMADSQEALRLTGFEHNAISPLGMATGLMPIILAKNIAEMRPDWFWLGGGQVDLKLGFKVSEFIERLDPFIADIYKDN